MILANRFVSTVLWIVLCMVSQINYALEKETIADKASACFSCHGMGGNSKNTEYPSLAGQPARYISAQLRAFKKGRRRDFMMQDRAEKLSMQEIKTLSVYFSKLTLKNTNKVDVSLAKKGQAKVAMCMGCHGRNLQGRGGFPRLAKQQFDYLKRQLLNFKHKVRSGGPMNAISGSLSEKDIDEISAFLSQM